MPADLVHRRLLTESDPKGFEKMRTKRQNRPNSYLERKRRVSTRARMPKRGGRRRPFELQTLRIGGNGGP